MSKTSDLYRLQKMSNIEEDIKEFGEMTIYFWSGFYNLCLDNYFTT